MNEFSDFLKHKQAYVAVGEFKPGRFNQARQLFEKAVSTYSDGFQGAYLLQEPGSDKGIAIILWDNIGDMERNQSDVCQAALDEISGLFVKPPEIRFYEVCSEIGLAASALAAAGRVTPKGLF